jgi:hypothetical protein
LIKQLLATQSLAEGGANNIADTRFAVASDVFEDRKDPTEKARIPIHISQE